MPESGSRSCLQCGNVQSEGDFCEKCGAQLPPTVGDVGFPPAMAAEPAPPLPSSPPPVPPSHVPPAEAAVGAAAAGGLTSQPQQSAPATQGAQPAQGAQAGGAYSPPPYTQPQYAQQPPAQQPPYSHQSQNAQQAPGQARRIRRPTGSLRMAAQVTAERRHLRVGAPDSSAVCSISRSPIS